MKRAHRRWHRRIGWLLVPVLALTLGLIGFTRDAPPDNAAVPDPLPRTLPTEGH